MKQTGTVIEVKGNIARVECDKRSACDMCENAAHCVEKCKKVYATALNEAGAKPGDYVEIETETNRVLFNAVLVFILPIILAVAVYFAANAFLGEGVSVLLTFIVLVFSLIGFSFILNRASKGKTVSKIVKIL